MASDGQQSTVRRENFVVVALSEGRGAASELGLASLDLLTSVCTLSQFADSPLFSHLATKLAYLNPTYMLLSASCVEPLPTKLYAL